MKPLEDFADERARAGEVLGKSVAPWLEPGRDFIAEAQEEAADRHNYLTWAIHSARMAGTATQEFLEAMMVAIQANKTSYAKVEQARRILEEGKK